LGLVRPPSTHGPLQLELIPFRLTHNLAVVMPGLVPGTHALLAAKEDVGGRDKPGHDALGVSA
jgi:hypothetical protein